MYPVNQEQLQESLKRRGLYAKKVIQDHASFLNGKSKIFNYLLQDPPSADSLPVFVIPASEKLISLFSFTVRCKLPEDRSYQCFHCFQRNECLRKICRQLETQMIKMNQRKLTIDMILSDYTIWRRTPRMEFIINYLIELMIDLGEIKD